MSAISGTVITRVYCSGIDLYAVIRKLLDSLFNQIRHTGDLVKQRELSSL
jgi:hypothetical protein